MSLTSATLVPPPAPATPDTADLDVVAALKAGTERPFADAVAMPPAVYTSERFLALEQAHIFNAQWLCVGRANSLAQAGDYFTCEVAGQPILVLRDQAGTLHAFSNVCLHRMSVLLEGSGNVRGILCPYHAWSYDLEGRLRGAPQMQRQSGFDKADYRLPEIRLEIWEGWIYVTFDTSLPPVTEQLAPLSAMIEQYGMGDYAETFREEHVWDTNWKILAENFMESYHLPMLHRATVGPFSRLEDMDCPPGQAAFNYHWITKDATLAIGNAHPDNTRLHGHWRQTTALLALYPNHLITLTPGYFWYLVVSPRGVNKVHILFGGGLSPDFVADPRGTDYIETLKNLLDRVNAEDRVGVEAVFRGVSARLARPGHLSHLERPNYDFARYLASRIPDGA